jgi:hypothetical protein
VFLWLRDTYPELQLGVYYHCADNTHFYERHFELADKILSEEVKDENQSSMIIPEVFFTIEAGKMLLTEHGLSFIERVNELIETEKPTQQEFKNILNDFIGVVDAKEIEDGVPEIQD